MAENADNNKDPKDPPKIGDVTGDPIETEVVSSGLTLISSEKLEELKNKDPDTAKLFEEMASKIDTLEKANEDSIVKDERQKLLLELAQVSKSPATVKELENASPDTIKGAIIQAKAQQGPSHFGSAGKDNESPVGPAAYKDPATGIWYDLKGNATDYKG